MLTFAVKLLASLVVLLGLTGCLGVAGQGGSPVSPAVGDGPADPTGGTEPADGTTPTPPAPLTAESAAAYAVALETDYREVRILRTTTVDVTNVDVRCEPASTAASGDGYEVEVACGFSNEFRDGGAVGIADGVPYVATYLVTPDSVERLGEEPTLP